ncbi:MAG: CinA family protein [Alphaproteobacteria bacterium]|nr:CinA family protein [Alphaproteobacteria bacterium]
MFSPEIHDLARCVLADYEARKLKIVTAESCTGGLIAAALTDIPGSSSVFERGFVAYSNDAKVEALGVMPEILGISGAVSPDVAEEMAQGALDFSQANVCVSVTGVAGPDGGTPLKPVGLVYFGLAVRKSHTRMHYRCQFEGDRCSIRMQAVAEGLRLLHSAIEK